MLFWRFLLFWRFSRARGRYACLLLSVKKLERLRDAHSPLHAKFEKAWGAGGYHVQLADPPAPTPDRCTGFSTRRCLGSVAPRACWCAWPRA